MALDERFFIAAPLNQYFVDKDTGEPLAGGTLEFYRDSSRVTPKAVYQLQGTPGNYSYTALPNPITLSSVGTIQNSGGDNEVMYFFPYDGTPDSTTNEIDLYYIVCKNSDGTEQFTREAWPNIHSGNDPTAEPISVNNEISNSQFGRIFINQDTSTTYTVSGASSEEFEFAPDWTFVISGTGTVVVQRVAVAGNDNIPTYPGYVLDVNVSSGITECLLRQRFDENSGLWSEGFLSGLFVAQNQGTGTVALDMEYDESSGLASPLQVVSAAVTTSYQEFIGSVEVPASSNTDKGENAYVDVYLTFAASTHVRVTSIQVTPTPNEVNENLIPYDAQSINREQALMGDYYIPALEKKPVPSILVGWDFGLNPAQINGTTTTMTTTAAYIWDQTIGKSKAANVSVQRNGLSGGFQMTTTSSTEVIYLLQYLTGKEAKAILGNRLSVNINGWKTAAGDDVTAKVFLVRGSSGASVPSLGTTIGTVDSNGDLTVTASNWTEIPRSGLGTAQATLKSITSNSEINGNDVDYGFNGWKITDGTQIGDTGKFAILVSFVVPDSSTVIVIDSISLIPGDIPTRPAPLTTSQTTKQCEKYFETSFGNGITAPSSTLNNALVDKQTIRELSGATTAHMFYAGFGAQFRTEKRANPTLTIYSGVSTSANQVYITAFRSGTGTINEEKALSNYTLLNKNTYGFSYRATTGGTIGIGGSTLADEAVVRYHYIADARYGVV